VAPRAGWFVAPAAALAAYGALGVTLAERVVRPRRKPRLDHEVLAVGDEEVCFPGGDEEMSRPGRYGIYWTTGHAVVGPVIARREGCVARVLERVDEGTLRPGRVGIGHVSVGDPRTAWGLDFDDVVACSDAGPMPCWEVPGERSSDPAALAGGGCDPATWALLVHGYGGSRASTLDVLPLVHRLGMPAIAVGYRNDPGAPASPDGRYHLGATEWRDLEAAMRHAVGRGAERLLLVGWSMGGAIVMQALVRSELGRQVVGVVLDCPVLDWRAVLAVQARRRRVPAPLLALAIRLVELRIGSSFDALDWTVPERAGQVDVPVLVFHGASDPLVPLATSEAFARVAPCAELEATPLAGHVGSWNVDPAGYERTLSRFCRRVAPPGGRRPA
jgi:pimeloyl-ACP methyl ester carboxylesterase